MPTRYPKEQMHRIQYEADARTDSRQTCGGERRLIEIAASTFNQEHEFNLWGALAGLDEESAVAVERAIHTFNDRSP